ncbi:hypothetical protein MMC24_004693 [Lignoscripta atroalba]|nr:hypothetical protein [Lignoscripta atroalba]
MVSRIIAIGWRSRIPGHYTVSTINQARYASSLDHSCLDGLYSKLTSRRLPLLYDNPTPLPSHLLDVTLADFLPPPVFPVPSIVPLISFRGGGLRTLPPSHHLIYFPPPTPLSSLLPDGTDPDQSPGDPFVRRMWAGGRIAFNLHRSSYLELDGFRADCLERISDVTIKGSLGNEKVFVTIERRVSRTVNEDDEIHGRSMADRSEEKQREILMQDRNCSVIEHRNIVFMRERSPQVAADAAKAQGKIVKSPYAPTFSHSLTPTAALLFRFSALTFNAHSIHLDKQYCREIEGHRNLLVHGPLSLVLMVEMLRRHLASNGGLGFEGEHRVETQPIAEIEYRNLAPLYAEEEMKICGRDKGNGVWDVWIEGRDGGYAVKGEAKTRTTLSQTD